MPISSQIAERTNKYLQSARSSKSVDNDTEEIADNKRFASATCSSFGQESWLDEPNGESNAFVSPKGEMLEVQEQKAIETRTVKVGKRVFEVNVPQQPTVVVTSPDQHENGPGNYPSAPSYQNLNEDIHSTRALLPVPEEPIARRVRRRKQRRNIRAPSSIISLPMSSITAFSGFTSVSTTSSIRPKRSKMSLFLNSFIMFGREFCYAIEASLTTPILLSIGLPINLYSLVWVISPILGFVLQPIIGSFSDKCKTRWGRRRPFILILAVLLLFGMTFFLNGEQFVELVVGNPNDVGSQNTNERSNVLATILVTIAGVVVFDFSADFIEGPIRAYVMDVCDEDDVKIGLFYQAVFTGMGGALGYASGGVSWVRNLGFGTYFPSDRQVVYVFAALIFIICVAMNLTSIPEKNRLKDTKIKKKTIFSKKRRGGKDVRSRKRRFPEREQKYMVIEEENPRKFDANNNLKRSSKDTKSAIDHDVITTPHTSNMISSRHMKYKMKSKQRKDRRKSKKTDNGLYGSFERPDAEQIHDYLTQSGYQNQYQSLPRDFSEEQNTYPAMKYNTHNGKDGVPLDNYGEKIKGVADLKGMASWANKSASLPRSGTRKQQENRRALPHPPTAPYYYNNNGVNGKMINVPSDSDSSSGSSFSNDYSPVRKSANKREKSRTYTAKRTEKSSDIVNYEDFSDPYRPLPHEAPRKYQKKSNRTRKTRIAEIRDDLDQDEDLESPLLRSDFHGEDVPEERVHGAKKIWKSIVGMPKEIKSLCIAHLFGWMAFLCVVLFFTDFVGQEVYGGDPLAPIGTERGDAYKLGVEMGSWGMTINAVASCFYCFLLKPMIKRFGARPIYMLGYFAFAVGALGMAIYPNVYCVLILSSLIGVMSATLYTLPYFLVAQYHEGYKKFKGTAQERGVGTDCALVTCMIQLAQIIVGLGIGALVVWLDTVTVTVVAGSISGFMGTLWVTWWVTY
ncbi:membrane-associated transporter protein-like [Styela clava]